jgi:ribosomal protein L37AE/L43A
MPNDECRDQIKCPDHPDARPLKARIPCTERGVWMCSACGKKLGEAGYTPRPEFESMIIDKGEVGKL